MRLSLAWANTVAQNVTLKVCVFVLAVICIALSLSTIKLALKSPLIIERGCFSKGVMPGSTERSAEEIEAFAKEAVHQRFDSEASVNRSYFSEAEFSARIQEQKELSTRSMNQVLIVRSVKTNGNTLTIDADRLISVAQIRSAFAFPLTATLISTSRSESNPYGLQIQAFIPQKMEQK